MDARSDQPLIRFERVTKRFGGHVAVEAVDLDVAAGEFFALLGPSGSGKTTLMRLLAGFETPDEGRILLDGQDLASLAPHQRPVNLMFQSYALFPHMSAAANVGYGLRVAGLPRAEIAARVEEMLTLVRLQDLGDRRPHQLSGGERQRVALARALARRPRVLLLDEPLAALDRRLREETQIELKAIQSRLGTTFIVVTHDQDEAMSLADRLAIMRQGGVAQVGTPREVYEHPADAYVAGFLGEANLLPGPFAGFGDEVQVAIRPDRMRLTAAVQGGAGLPGTVVDVGYLGDRTSWRVALADGRVLKVVAGAGAGAEALFRRGDRVLATFDPSAVQVIPK